MSRRQHKSRTRRYAGPAAVLYACEPLEPRTLLNAVPADGVIGNQVVIQGTGGDDVITLSSHSGRFGLTQFVDWTDSNINNGQTQSVQVLPTDSVFVETGGGKVTVNVKSTVAAVPTTINNNLSPAIETLNLGGPSGLQGIHGTINVTTSAGLWNITADDSADTTSRTGTLSDGSLTGLAPANITWDASKCHGLGVVTSSAGGNTLSALQTNVPTGIVGDSSGADDSVTVGNSSHGLADITAALSINSVAQVPAGLWNITIDDQSEPSFRNYILDHGSLAVIDEMGTPKANIVWDTGAVRKFTLKTEPMPAGGEVDVRSTDVPTTIVTGSDRPVKVGNPLTNGVSSILGNLYVSDPAGPAELLLAQIGDSTPRTVTLHTISVPGDSAAYGAIDGLAPATIAYKYTDISPVGLQLGGASNAPAAVHVAATETAVEIAGAASVAVGDAGSLQNIAGPLSISGGSLTVDDSADPISHNATISLLNVGDPMHPVPALAIGGLSAPIQSLAATLVINGGTGADAYTIDAPPLSPLQQLPMPHFGVVLNTGSGNDTVNVVASAFGAPLSINGQGGSDAFTVNYGGSVTDNLIFNGGSGSDTLTLIGPSANTPFSLAPGTVTLFGTLTTTYSAIKTLSLATGTFTIAGDLGFMNVSTSGFTTAKFQATSLGVLTIGSGTQATLVAGPMPLSKTLICTGLSISGTGKLDLANNSMYLDYTGADPIAAIRSYLASGYNGGMWNGNGIVTSAGDATHGLGFGDSADGIVAGLPNNTLLVRWTRYGDANFDGKVGFGDLVAVARDYGKSGQNWDQGDMNYDGTVGFDDLVTVARNYGAAAVLQPASAMLLPTAVLPTGRRKRR